MTTAAARHAYGPVPLWCNPQTIPAYADLRHTRLPPVNMVPAALLERASYELPGASISHVDVSCSSSLKSWSPCYFLGTGQRFAPTNGVIQMRHNHFSSGDSFLSSSSCRGDSGFPCSSSSAKSSAFRKIRFTRGCKNAADVTGANQFSDAVDISPSANPSPPLQIEVIRGAPTARSQNTASAALVERAFDISVSGFLHLVTKGDFKIASGTSCIFGGLVPVLFTFLLQLLSPETSGATGNESPFTTVMTFAGPEPSNALSMPTWIIHVASVAEWVAAMILVWKYGETKGNSAWKGLTWGMVPLLGGALCACTWHFFYNAESLEVLVAIQASLTVLGNFTLWVAAYRIWKLSQ